MKQKVLSHLTTECPWRDTLYWYDTIDSTNTKAKQMALQGAPHGTVLLAGSQTGGRGRMGRSFSSPDAMGVYLSVILRPGCTPDRLMHLTCAAAVACCQAVESAAGISPQIKWINDLVCGSRKLGGILTELSFDAQGLVDFAVIGIGINCRQQKEDFPEELQELATSLAMITGRDFSPAQLAAALIESLYKMSARLLTETKQILDTYRRRCITLGKEVKILHPEHIRCGTAIDLSDDGALIVRLCDGSTETVHSGEVSVRGMYGYL